MNVDLIDLKIDYAFKLIFGREGQEPVLVAFLNAVLKPMEGKQIYSLKYANSELNKEYAEDKKASLDIRAITEDGRHINIEIQLRNDHNMAKRSLYYWAELYSRQMEQRKPYDDLKDTIVINILNFDYLKETDEFHSVFRLLEENKHFMLTEALAMYFLEMPKLRQKWRTKEVSPKEDTLVRWLFLLDGNEDEEIMKELEVIAVEDSMIDRAMKDWEEASADSKQRELYFDRKKAILDELAVAEAAKLKAERAKAEGRAEGEAKGKVEAICRYLEVRFGSESQSLQDSVRTITDLDILGRIMDHVYVAVNLDEAKAFIQDILISQ